MEDILEELKKLADKKREDIQILEEENNSSERSVAEIDKYVQENVTDENIKIHFETLKDRFKCFDPAELERTENELTGVEECIQIVDSYFVEDDGFEDAIEQEDESVEQEEEQG